MAFIKLDRKLLNWEWFDDPNTLSVWIYLLLNASYEDNEFKGIKVPKGSLITGRKKIAASTGMSEQNVRTALNHLVLTNEVTIKPTKDYSLITLVKWALYQGDSEKVTNKSTNDLTNDLTNELTNDLTTTKEIKEIKNKRNTLSKERVKEKSKDFLPPTLEEVIAECKEKSYLFDPVTFFNYYQTRNWMTGKTKVKDWKAAMNVWSKREAPHKKKGRMVRSVNR